MDNVPGMPADSIMRVVHVPFATCRKRICEECGTTYSSKTSGLVHLAQDRRKPRIRVKRAELGKVARPDDEGRLALIRATSRRDERSSHECLGMGRRFPPG